MEVDGTSIAFESCILAAGSSAVMLPGLPEDERIVDSTGALELEEIPERLLVIGGGIIGLELGGVYDALGSAVTVVEMTDQLIPGCDRDLVKPLQKRLEGRFESILLATKVAAVEAGKKGLRGELRGRRTLRSRRPSTASSSPSAAAPNGDTLELESRRRRGRRATA